MNCVHEPGSRTMSKKFDSGKYRVEPGQKTGRVHSPRPARAPAAPAARPASLQRARSPSAHASCHNTAGVVRYTLPSSHCPSCCVTIQFLCIKTQPLSPLAFLLQYSCLYLCNTNHCIATQKPIYQPSKTTILQYNFFFSQYKLGSSSETVLH